MTPVRTKPPPANSADFDELTASEAAAHLGISRPTFYRRVGDGSIPPATRRIAGKRWYRFELDEAQRAFGKAPTRRKRRKAAA